MTGDSTDVILARIETKLDNVIQQGRDHETRLRRIESIDHESRLKSLETMTVATGVDYETRLRKIERIMWIAVGLGATGGGIAGAAIARAFGLG